MVEGVRGGGGEARGLVFGSRLWFVPRVCTGIYLKISAMNEFFNAKVGLGM
jgi:hypothetical protein